AAAARRLLAEIIGAEHFAIDVRTGEGIARHQFVRISETVRELEGRLRGGRFGREESFGNRTDGSAGIDGQSERGVDARRYTGAWDVGELLARFALAFDGSGEEGAIAAQRTVERGLGLVLAAVGTNARFGLGVARFEEGIGGEEIDVAVEFVGTGKGD